MFGFPSPIYWLNNMLEVANGPSRAPRVLSAICLGPGLPARLVAGAVLDRGQMELGPQRLFVDIGENSHDSLAADAGLRMCETVCVVKRTKSRMCALSG